MTGHGKRRETAPHRMAILAITSHGRDVRATRPHCAKARLVAALLAVVIGAACGGGGGISSKVQPQSQPQLSVQVSPSSLTFGNLVVGVTSASQTATLLNTGSAAVNLMALSTTGDFSQTNNCPSSLPSSANCTFLVYFTPTQTGARTGTLSITSSGSSAAQTVSLSGTGIGIAAQVTPGSLTYAAQLVGTASTAQNLVLANVGTTPFNFIEVFVTGDFSQTSNCPATLAAGSSCTFQMVFTPTATGTRNGSVTITTTAANTLPVVNLTGTGVSNSAQVSPGSLTFANQTVGTTSVSQPVTLNNTGFGGLTIAGIAASANFGETNNCGSSVAANGSCTVNVTFSPTASGPLTGTLTITDNSGGVAGSTQKVSLQGTGTVAAAGFSALVLGFPNQAPTTTSAALTETVTNTGTVNLAISTVTIGGLNPSDFAKSADTCTGATLAPTSTCTVNVTFTPSVAGSFAASLLFADNAAGSPQTVSLTGTGIGPVATFSASTLTFTNQALNTTSAPQTETVTSAGTTSLDISGVTISGANQGDFAKTADTCTGATVPPPNTCAVSVTFTPSAAGPRTASLNFSDDAGGGSQVISLTGNPLPGVYTQRYDNSRSGANTQEVILTPSNVNVNQFGKLFALPVDGQVYAQPLYMQNVTIPGQGVHNVVYVATQNNSVYAFDADGQSTTPLWHTSFTSATITPVPSSDIYPAGWADISPIIGITSTPAIDPAGGTLYVTAKTREPLGSNSCSSNGSYNYCYRLHALDITTGAEKFGGPMIISASVPGTGYDNVNGTVTFLALWQLQRPGLLLLNGTVYIGFGSHADIDPWHGWLMAYNATTLQQQAVFCTSPNLPVGGAAHTGGRGSIWQGGGGIVADTNVPPNLYVVTGNGNFDANQGGVDYGDSVLKMQLVETTAGQFQFQVLDYFSPANSAILDADDLDLGSSPVLLLPPLQGTNLSLLALGGKDGRIWLLNQDNLGGFVTSPVPDAGAVEVIPQIGSDSLLGGLTYWNGNIYVQENASWINQFTLSNGLMPQSPTFTSEAEYGGFPNPIPVVSANGTANGIIWIVSLDLNTKLAILWALDASDVSNNTELYDSVQELNNRDQAGGYVKFVIPTVANGKVYVGTATEVDVYGLLP